MNTIAYLVKGNVALSITLTAISSLVTVFTIPLLVNLAMQNFMGEAAWKFSLSETTFAWLMLNRRPDLANKKMHNKNAQ